MVAAAQLLSAQDIKDRIDLSVYVAGHLGFSTNAQNERKIGSGQTVAFYSPFKSENTPSFTVFGNNTWKDFASGKGGGADIFQLLDDLRGMKFADALNHLREFLNSPTYSEHKVVEKAAQRSKTTWTQERIAKIANIGFNSRLKMTHGLPYLASRGISDFSAFRFQLGTIAEPYFIADAEGTIKIMCRAHTIPYTLYTPTGHIIRSVELRVDPKSVSEKWAEFQVAQPKRADRMQNNICFDRNITPVDFLSDLVKYLNLPRYLRRGGNNYLFNADRLVKVKNGKFERVILEQLIIVEGAYDAIILEQMGYPAVAIPQNHKIDLKEAFSKVRGIYALYDNDEAGRDRLQSWAAAIGADKVHPVEITGSYKDATDVYKSDPNVLSRILASAGLRTII